MMDRTVDVVNRDLASREDDLALAVYQLTEVAPFAEKPDTAWQESLLHS